MTKNIKIRDIGTGAIEAWSITKVLEEINRDRSEHWTPYDETDWEGGWDEWIEGDIYSRVVTETESSKNTLIAVFQKDVLKDDIDELCSSYYGVFTSLEKAYEGIKEAEENINDYCFFELTGKKKGFKVKIEAVDLD